MERNSGPHSVLDAIKMGMWDYEPDSGEEINFDATQALPGTEEKLMILAKRVQQGLPLWHPSDRQTFDEHNNDDEHDNDDNDSV